MISEFREYFAMAGHCKAHILCLVTWLCRPFWRLGPTRIKYPTRQIHTCVYTRYDRINSETKKSPNKKNTTCFQIIFRIEQCTTRHGSSYQNTMQCCKRSMACHTCNCNAFVTVRIVHPVDRHTAESSSWIISMMHICTASRFSTVLIHWRSFANRLWPAATPPRGVLIGNSSTIPKLSSLFQHFDQHQFFSIFTLLFT